MAKREIEKNERGGDLSRRFRTNSVGQPWTLAAFSTMART